MSWYNEKCCQQTNQLNDLQCYCGLYECHGHIHSQVIAHRRVWASMLLWPPDLWLANPKIEVIYYLWPTFIQGLKILGQSVLKLKTGQCFDSQCYCNLDLWPRNIKVNSGHLLVLTNLHTKLEDPTSMCSQVFDRTRYWSSMSQWTWPLT